MYKYTLNNFNKRKKSVYEAISEELNGKPYSVRRGELREFIEEYNKPIELDSFKIRKSLEPNIWQDGELNSRIRLHLMDIADDFFDTLGINWVKPEDVILTGSLANYNWSEFSDFDLHIVMDFSKVDERVDFVEEYFNSKKNEWNDEHDNLKIFGYPVELYVQDVNADNVSSGVYSLYENDWIIEPTKGELSPIKLDKFLIKYKSHSIIEKIEHFENLAKSENDKHKLSILSDKVDTLIDKLHSMRKSGLDKSGEMNPYNIIYKVLRRTGFLDKIYDIKSLLYDKIMSL